MRGGPSSSALVLAEDADSGELLGPLEHRARYSVTGFNWGYDGAGPRDLARALLAAALGTEAACPGCVGRAPAGCGECTDGLRADLPDVALVRDVLLRLGDSWELHEDELLAWCNENGLLDDMA